jgi:hypothetical protein
VVIDDHQAARLPARTGYVCGFLIFWKGSDACNAAYDWVLTLKCTAQVGLTALCVLQHVFKEKFELLGIRQEIDALKNTGML